MSFLSSCLWLGRFVLDTRGSFSKNITSKWQNYGALVLVNKSNYTSISENQQEAKASQVPKESTVNVEPEKPEKQLEELNDKYKRVLADRDNMRKRLLKQIEEAKIYGIQNFCKDLLEVADVLGKATECVPKEEVKDSNPHLKNLYEGLTMTEAQLHKVFKRHGLVQLNPLNEKFDPNMHEALFQQEVKGKAAGTIVVVSKIGYKLHERVIRPALVGVAKD